MFDTIKVNGVAVETSERCNSVLEGISISTDGCIGSVSEQKVELNITIVEGHEVITHIICAKTAYLYNALNTGKAFVIEAESKLSKDLMIVDQENDCVLFTSDNKLDDDTVIAEMCYNCKSVLDKFKADINMLYHYTKHVLD